MEDGLDEEIDVDFVDELGEEDDEGSLGDGDDQSVEKEALNELGEEDDGGSLGDGDDQSIEKEPHDVGKEDSKSVAKRDKSDTKKDWTTAKVASIKLKAGLTGIPRLSILIITCNPSTPRSLYIFFIYMIIMFIQSMAWW